MNDVFCSYHTLKFRVHTGEVRHLFLRTRNLNILYYIRFLGLSFLTVALLNCAGDSEFVKLLILR